MNSTKFEVALIGGGIIGMATAMALALRYRISLIVIEAEKQIAIHQTGNNSGVIHSGLYYKPGSLKARNCTVGREAIYRFCEENAIPYERCGKVVIATHESELPAIEELESRGRANGLQGLRRLRAEESSDYEPRASGIAGLFVAETGIVDFAKVTEAFGRKVEEAGGTIYTGAKVYGFQSKGDEIILTTTRGEIHCHYLVNCSGLHCDRIARMCEVEPELQIVPFRGEYYELVPERFSLVKNLIYPVPNPEFPFLGVHFTRMIAGGVEAGPNAVWAWKREGYQRWSFSMADLWEMVSYKGFWRMARKYWKTGIGEFYRSWSKGAHILAMKILNPAVQAFELRL
jgi:L-2-hydroxyglutarate oxidase